LEEGAMQKQQLFRVRVLERHPQTGAERSIDVGPAMVEDHAQQLCDAIAMKIREGKEKTWADPIIYPDYS
jgi:hypothetical protein